MTFEQLCSYHSSRADSICPGHPEIEHEGIELTTGPLGQGIANAVGLAMATKHLGATYNRPNYPVVNNTTWCMIGDACLQEGVALEAIQLAGHWRLNNLVVIYDNNQITCDGSVDMCNNEDVNAKMRACGWDVLEVEDGNYDVDSIVKALVTARASTEMPTFINVHTVIGVGSQAAGNASTHGAALGPEDVISIKKKFGMDPEKHLVVSDEVYDFFREAKLRGKKLEKDWNEMVNKYAEEHPDVYREFLKRTQGEMLQDWTKIIPEKKDLPTTPTPTRKAAGIICNPLASNMGNIMVGTADLSPSVAMIWKDKVDFQHVSLSRMNFREKRLLTQQQPDLKTACGINGNYTGRYIHWGVREHAMASITNGLAAFHKGTILPVTSSFFMFYVVSRSLPTTPQKSRFAYSIRSTLHLECVWEPSSIFRLYI